MQILSDNNTKSMFKKIETGILEFDEVIGGGLPENTVTLVYGQPKVGKTIFAQHFLYQGLVGKQHCIYVHTDCNVIQLIENMRRFNFVIEKSLQDELFYSIDLYSKKDDTVVVGNSNTTLSSLSNPTDFLIKTLRTLRYITIKEKVFRAILDECTPLFLYNEPLLVVRTLKSWIRSIKTEGGTGLIILSEGLIDIKYELMLKNLVDNIIHFTIDGKIVIEAMIGQSKTEIDYNVTNFGIVVQRD